MVKIYIEPNRLIGVKKNILYNGLKMNKNVEMVNSKEISDLIILDFRDCDFLLNNNMANIYSNKTIILDYRDNCNEIYSIPCLKYFKRSVVDKESLKLKNYNREVIPISYCLRKEVLEMDEFKNIDKYKRDIDISVFFTPNDDSYRNRIAQFIQETFKNYNIHIGICGNNGVTGRNQIQMSYFNKMFHSKIVINCNPCDWEGDYRTWESLASGALVFVDRMITPIIHPLIDGTHIIYYDRDNLNDLKEKVLYYLNNEKHRVDIAKEGNYYALNYHKPSDRIDEILSVL